MGRIVVTEFISVDGVIEDPGGNEKSGLGGWAFEFDRGDAGNKFKLDETMASEALLLGRVTDEGFAAAWPSRKDDAGFADKFNNMPKFVVSRTFKDRAGRTRRFSPGRGRGRVGAARPGRRRHRRPRERHAGARAAGQRPVDELDLMFFSAALGRARSCSATATTSSSGGSLNRTPSATGRVRLVLQRA